MEKVKKFLKVQTEPPCEHRPRQQVQAHPQVGRRRRKSRARRDGRLSGASGHSNKSDNGTLTGPGSIVNLNPHVQTVTQAETLRQKAFAKLRMFNFSLNWDLHMNQCKPRSLLNRRLYRSRKYDDNELYRSNSFRFQRFERGNDATGRRNGKQDL